MNEYSPFYQNILKHVDLSDDELATVSSFYSFEKIEKGKIILKKGEVCKFERYVLEGCFKIFYTDEQLREHILYFAVEDWWTLDIGSFVTGNPSELNIQALEESVTLTIPKNRKEQLYREVPKMEKLFRIMNQKSLSAMHMRMISMLHENADKRYLDFILRYPTLPQRIAQHQIAAYLGVSHEFLSKVKKKILRNKK